VIKVAVKAVPIKVPATPSLEVKSATTTEASPAATALFVSTNVRDFSFAMTPEIVSVCYCV
jgi:hypothetical protein